MAMPTRSARTTEFGEKAPTPVTLGPGSYLGPTEVAKTRPSLAAFASSQIRSWQEKPSRPAGPGPGSYGASIPVAPTENDVRPSYCFESRAPRLAPQYTGSTAFGPSTVVQVPGPGSYETFTPGGQHIRRDSQRVVSRQKTVPGAPNRFNPPSVPRKEQSFGYNIDPQGKLLALSAPCCPRTGDRTDSAGPGDYDPQSKDWWAGVGAAKFSRGLRKTVFDGDWAVKDMRPGPGDYDPKLRPSYHLEMPGSSPFMSGVPKSDTRAQTGPGPGQYAHHSPLGVNTSASNAPCFSSSSQRGAWLRNDQCPYNEPETGNIPGPGAYGSLHDYSSFNKPVPKTLTDEKIGFSSTGKRTSPGPSPQTAGMPGPGDYDLEVQSIAGGLRHKSRIGCKGVFGSSGDRFRIRSPTQINKTPMQLWDQGKILKRVVVMHQAPKPTSSFKSETNRFRARSASDASAVPPATKYVRKDCFDAIVEKGAKSKTIRSFLSTADRREGGAFERKDTGNIPGPGAYNIAMSKAAAPPPRSRAQTRSRLPQGERFSATGLLQSEVGPGSHEIAGSLIKKTFNITFGGACTPAGGGRMAHRALHARKIGHATQLLGGITLPPGAGDSDALEPFGAKETLQPPSSVTDVRVAA